MQAVDQTIQTATQEAKHVGHQFIGGLHVLAAIIQHDSAVAALLESEGITLGRVRSELLRWRQSRRFHEILRSSCVDRAIELAQEGASGRRGPSYHDLLRGLLAAGFEHEKEHKGGSYSVNSFLKVQRVNPEVVHDELLEFAD